MKHGVLFEPTEAQRYTVEIMSSIGIPHAQISEALDIDAKTLRKHFRSELDVGKTKVLTKVAESLVRQALSGNMTAAIFYLKTQGGWKEQAQSLNVSVEGELEHKHTVSDGFAAVASALEQAARAKQGGPVGAGEVDRRGASYSD